MHRWAWLTFHPQKSYRLKTMGGLGAGGLGGVTLGLGVSLGNGDGLMSVHFGVGTFGDCKRAAFAAMMRASFRTLSASPYGAFALLSRVSCCALLLISPEERSALSVTTGTVPLVGNGRTVAAGVVLSTPAVGET